MLKKYLRDYLVLFLMVGTIIALDQISKAVIRQNIALGDAWSPWPWLMPYARLVHWYNTGVAFGMFQGMGGVFSVVAVAVSIAIVYYFPRVDPKDWTLRLAMGLQMGGALGNLIDRVSLGHVTDFISVGNFAVFNIADACITVGVAVLLLGIYLQERKKPRADHPGTETSTANPEDVKPNGD